MDVDSSDALQRVLAVYCDYSDTQPRFNAPESGCSCVDVLEGRAGTQVDFEGAPQQPLHICALSMPVI